jgi:hypothetical protein
MKTGRRHKQPSRGEKKVLDMWVHSPEDLSHIDESVKFVEIKGDGWSSKTVMLESDSETLFEERKLEDRRKLWTAGLDLSLLPKHITELSILSRMLKMRLDLEPLVGIENLKKLELSDEFEGTDVTPIGRCSSLKEVRLKFCIDSIDFLSDLEKIEQVEVETRVSRLDLSPISSCASLRDFSISGNDYIDLRPLESCHKLRNLEVWGDLIGVHLLSSPSIKKLSLSACRLVYPWETHAMYPHRSSPPFPPRIRKREELLDLSQLDGCKQLESINLSDNNLYTLELDVFYGIRVGKRAGKIPKFDLRNNPLIAVYLPDGLIPDGCRTEDYILIDDGIPIIDCPGYYGRYVVNYL